MTRVRYAERQKRYRQRENAIEVYNYMKKMPKIGKIDWFGLNIFY